MLIHLLPRTTCWKVAFQWECSTGIREHVAMPYPMPVDYSTILTKYPGVQPKSFAKWLPNCQYRIYLYPPVIAYNSNAAQPISFEWRHQGWKSGLPLVAVLFDDVRIYISSSDIEGEGVTSIVAHARTWPSLHLVSYNIQRYTVKSFRGLLLRWRMWR